jgi:signal peptidase I
MATALTRSTGSRTSTDAVRWIPFVRICGRSMLPTLAHGQVLLTRPVRGRVAAGDVVVLSAATGRLYVKRIAALPGDVVTLGAGRLYVNGRSWDGGPHAAAAYVARWHVPPGHCFVVGDNPHESDDSRVWREPFVALARIAGVAVRLWPWRCLAARP